MIDRQKENIFFEQFKEKSVEIILDNQMHYTGLVISIDSNSLKIQDKFNKEIFILKDKIVTIHIISGGGK